MNSKRQLLMFHVWFFTLICLPIVSAQSHQAGDIVQDSHDVSMVFVPAGDVMIGATLDEAVEKCEKLRLENKSPRAGDCRQGLSRSVPDGVDYLVTPVQEVYLKDYFIDQYEVTIKSFQICVNENVCNNAVLEYLQGFSPYKSDDEPMRYISYLDAELYCGWRGGYIPSEAEWEYAARGPERYAFPWGNTFDGSIVNFCDANCKVPIIASVFWDDGFTSIAPVGSHLQDVSWVGAIGMAGNLSEWTSTRYVSQNLVDNSSESNEITRIVKGGYFGSLADQILLWRRFPLFEGEIREGVGFRCARNTFTGN